MIHTYMRLILCVYIYIYIFRSLRRPARPRVLTGDLTMQTNYKSGGSGSVHGEAAAALPAYGTETDRSPSSQTPGGDPARTETLRRGCDQVTTACPRKRDNNRENGTPQKRKETGNSGPGERGRGEGGFGVTRTRDPGRRALRLSKSPGPQL